MVSGPPSASRAPGVSVAFVRPIAELLGRIGGDPARFLAAVAVGPAAPPEAFVDGARVDAALAAEAAARGDPAFALTLAQAAMTRPLGLFGHLVWLSGTVGDALARAVRYFAMISQRTSLELAVGDGGVARLTQHPRGRGVRRGRILTEFPFASLALRARAATEGRFALQAVRFRHPGAMAPAYRAVFGGDVEFGAARDELVFAAAALALPLATADPITSAALEASAARLAASPHASTPLPVRVRQAAAELTGPVTLAALAARLAISERTLRRRLAEAGCTVRALADDARRERADGLLASGATVKEVAFALGFSEPAAFSRAYLRWTGRRPGARRPPA